MRGNGVRETGEMKPVLSYELGIRNLKWWDGRDRKFWVFGIRTSAIDPLVWFNQTNQTDQTNKPIPTLHLGFVGRGVQDLLTSTVVQFFEWKWFRLPGWN